MTLELEAIETKGLTKRFPEPRRYRDLLLRPFATKEVTAVEDVSLTVGKGECFGLLGPNGAGKTTLIKTLCTLVLPTAGSARVNGYDVAREGRLVRRSIGYVLSEERSFYWRLTGRQNLRFFAALNNLGGVLGEQKVAEVVALTGLDDAVDRGFREYSSGMKQRLAIARGLLTDPETLFLDEPTRNLDPLGTRKLRRFVRDVLVAERRRTVVIATNNLQEAEDLCDRVAIIHHGRIKICGGVEEIKRRLGDRRPYEIRVRGGAGQVRERLARLGLEGDAVRLAADPIDPEASQLVVELRPDGAPISSVIEGLVAAGVKIESCVPERASLEEVFARAIE